MDQKMKSSLIHCYLMFVCATIQRVCSTPSPRICIEYDGNDLKQRICTKSQNKCMILWRREVKNGNEHITFLKQGCWTYENNDREFCGRMCVSRGLYDRPNNTEFCCCQTNLCNNNFTLSINETLSTKRNDHLTTRKGVQESSHERHLINGIVSACSILVVFASVILAVCVYYQKQMPKKKQVPVTDQRQAVSFSPQHIRLGRLINRGKFGEIWLGTLHSKTVAIKKFENFQKRSWENEKEIYSLGLEHSGILKYFGALIYPDKNNTTFLLVVEYHPNGSLRQTLGLRTLSWQEVCIMIESIAGALAYLHGEQENRKQQLTPIVIAHRDLTTENILVREDGNCVICDFGLSQTISLEEKHHVVKNGDQQVGSLRYMAPEALEGHINLNDMVSQLKQIDIYAMGIVFWEICSRCHDLYEGSVTPKFRLPFDHLECDVTLHSLKNYVLVKKMRPPFPEIWNKGNERVMSLLEMINDCWDNDAEARLSASCVCQRVAVLKGRDINTLN